MERRKAIAVAAAVTMSLTSGVLAIGANFGALGFAGAARQNPVVASARLSRSTAVNTTSRERERDDSARAAEPSDNGVTSTRGEQND
jgi:hypothetical protein